MKVQVITPKITFKNNHDFLAKYRSKFVRDDRTKAAVLKEYFEHPDLADKTGKAEKVIENLMYKTTQIVSIGCIDAINTLRAIQYKHPHLEKLTEECIELLEYYNACKTW